MSRSLLTVALLTSVVVFALDARGQDRIPKESFAILKATDQNGGLIFIMANFGYKDYKFKSDYPWFLWIEIMTKDKNANGHPTDDEAEVLNKVEDLIDAELKKACTAHYIGRTTLNGSRELLYYLDDPENANPVLQRLVNDPTPIREFEYTIEEDRDWESVASILNSN